MTIENEKIPAPKQASGVANQRPSKENATAESIVDARAADGNGTSSKVGRADALTRESIEAIARKYAGAYFSGLLFQDSDSFARFSDDLILAVFPVEQPAAAPIDEPSVNDTITFSSDSLTLSGAQLLEALDFIAPDRNTDRDQLESEVTIQYGEGHAGKGMYCWCTEYPEEGAIFIDGSTAVPAAPAPAPSPADERAAQKDGYFVYDPEGNGFELYSTDTERAEAHNTAIKECRRAAIDDGEWPLEVQSIVSGIVTHRTTATQVDGDSCDYAARAASANETGADVSGAYTYSSVQATNCARCGNYKHTPLRIDWMGGYVCLTCIDRELESRSSAMAAEAVAILAGYALVPVKITDAMIEAAMESHYGKRRVRQHGGAAGIVMTVNEHDWSGVDAMRRFWKGALSAVPQPAQADARVGLTDEQREAIDFVIGWYEQSTIADNPYREHIAALRALLAAHPGQPEPNSSITDDQRDKIERAEACLRNTGRKEDREAANGLLDVLTEHPVLPEPRAEVTEEVIPWERVLELGDKHGMQWAGFSGWRFESDDKLYAFANDVARYAIAARTGGQ